MSLSTLRARFGGRLQSHVPLAPYTTLRIGGPAEYLLEVHTAEELIAAEPVTITGTESPGNKGTPPAGGDWPGAFWWNGSATT